MKNLQSILRELFDDISKLDDSKFLKKSRDLLGEKSKSSVLIAIFLEFQNSISRSILINLGFLFETIEYQDIIQAMLELGNKNLPAYHFAASTVGPGSFGTPSVRMTITGVALALALALLNSA